MVRPLWLLNILLTALAIGLVAALARSIVSPAAVESRQEPHSVLPEPSLEMAAAENTGSQLTARHGPISQFDSILRGNLFNDPDEGAKQKERSRSLPPPPPLPLLQGTIIIGKSAKAILKQGNREDLYEVGDRVAGGILSRVDVDRVLIDFGNRRAEVMLKSTVRSLPPPPPTISLHGGGASKTKAGSVPRAQNPGRASEEQGRAQPTINSPRMRRAQEIIELQQQMQGAQK